MVLVPYETLLLIFNLFCNSSVLQITSGPALSYILSVVSLVSFSGLKWEAEFLLYSSSLRCCNHCWSIYVMCLMVYKAFQQPLALVYLQYTKHLSKLDTKHMLTEHLLRMTESLCFILTGGSFLLWRIFLFFPKAWHQSSLTQWAFYYWP